MHRKYFMWNIIDYLISLQCIARFMFSTHSKIGIEKPPFRMILEYENMMSSLMLAVSSGLPKPK